MPYNFSQGEAIRLASRRGACPTISTREMLDARGSYGASSRRLGSGRAFGIRSDSAPGGRALPIDSAFGCVCVIARSQLRRLEFRSDSAAGGRALPIYSGFGCVCVIARSRVCRLEFRRRICAQYLAASECSRGTPDSLAHNQHAFQNRDSSGA